MMGFLTSLFVPGMNRTRCWKLFCQVPAGHVDYLHEGFVLLVAGVGSNNLY